MNKKLLNLALVAIATMLMLSCSKTENGNVEYIPFQETDDGQWGMISMDGYEQKTIKFSTCCNRNYADAILL